MINKWHYLIFIVIHLCLPPNLTEAANILAFLPSCSPSHLIIEMAVVRAMAERNHNVTVVSVLPLKPEWLHSNIISIQLNSGSIDMDTAINATKLKGFARIHQSLNMKRFMSNELAKILDDPKFQAVLHNPGNKYDLMLYGYLFADFFFGIAEHFDCPMALLWPNMPFAPILNLIGNPLGISYTTVTFINIDHASVGFLFRLKNMVALMVEPLIDIIQQDVVQQVYR